LWAIISCCVGASPWASAETFALKNGNRVEGTIVRAIGNAITIRRDDRGMYQCPLSDVDWVALTDRQGLKTQGTLEDWSKGTYFLGTEEGVVAIKDGQIIKDAVQPKRPAAATPRQPVM
jgi:hypothetical protein